MMKKILGSCPLCGNTFEFVQATIDRREEIIEEVREDCNKSIIYKGAKFLFTSSVAVVLSSCGVPHWVGKELGKGLICGIENITSNIVLSDMDDDRFIYLIEFRCKGCGYVAKRYYTDKLE